VVDGNRIGIEREGDLELDPAAWHTLKAVHDGGAVAVSLGGIRIISERDGRFERAPPGKVGVIAAGGTEARFDDLRVDAPAGRR
jgi:hypothetical protein